MRTYIGSSQRPKQLSMVSTWLEERLDTIPLCSIAPTQLPAIIPAILNVIKKYVVYCLDNKTEPDPVSMMI
jgi:hypothetical protein